MKARFIASLSSSSCSIRSCSSGLLCADSELQPRVESAILPVRVRECGLHLQQGFVRCDRYREFSEPF